MAFTTRRTILFGDCDPAGVVYTPRISYFVIEAVHDYLAEALGGPAVRRLFDLGILPPARALSIEFLAPMAWDETIDIEVRCSDLSTTAFSFAITARKGDGDTAFTASLTHVCVSPETHRPMPLPDALRAALSGAR